MKTKSVIPMRLFLTLLLVGFFAVACKKSDTPSPSQPVPPSRYTDLLNFNETNGANPLGDLTLSGNTLYGMTASGGANNKGVIFSINTDGSGYKDLLDFDRVNGSNPAGSLTLSGSVLYGMTASGGANNKGVVFSINTDGSGYKDLLDFDGSNGFQPYGSLILSNGNLYGMTPLGGINGDGCIFSLAINGTAYKKLFDFNDFIDTTGENPYGSLIISGNVLYGIASNGGTHSEGRIFSIDTDGTRYRDLYDFYNNHGLSVNPSGSLVLSGNILYGMSYGGGANDSGNIFSIDTNGLGYKDIFDFNGINGGLPYGSLLLSGGVLYGMTSEGGVNKNGNIFSINANGTGYTDLYDFNSKGVYPYGSLIISGNILYGMVGFPVNGYTNYGNIFSYNLQ